MKIYLDTEGTGLQAETLLIQFSIDRQEIQFMNLWRNDFEKLDWLFAQMYDPKNTLIGYNLYFDAFKLYQLFHMYYFKKELTSFDRPVKPFKIQFLDLMNHAMYKSVLAPYAFLKDANKSIAKIKEIPIEIKEIVKETVFSSIELPKTVKIACSEHQTKKEGLITLSFYIKSSISLKNLMIEYGLETQKIQEVWALPAFHREEGEKQYLPYPEERDEYEISRKQNYHILNNPRSAFWKYAKNDILYLFELEDRLGNPIPDFNDDCIASNTFLRYQGLEIDLDLAYNLLDEYNTRIKEIEDRAGGLKLTKIKDRTEYLRRINRYLEISEEKDEKAEAWKLEIFAKKNDAIGRAARDMLNFNSYSIFKNTLEKLLESKTYKFHPYLNALGTATGRMTGGGGINAQGIGSERLEGTEMGIRDCIRLSQGGDFDAFEIAIGASVYNDPVMLDYLNRGIDFHSMNATLFYDNTLPYEEFIKHKKTEPYRAQRNNAKIIDFAIMYGAGLDKVMQILGCTEEKAQEALDRYYNNYPGAKAFVKKIEEDFITVDVKTWSKDCIMLMHDCVQDVFGLRRYFTFEKQICALFWDLGQQNLLNNRREFKDRKVIRKEMKGEQTFNNALKSAFLGSAITIQQSIYRQAGNTPIQMTGASITKKLMQEIWKKHAVPTFNIHDELNIGIEYASDFDSLNQTVNDFIEEYKSKVKYLSMEWKQLNNWGEKDNVGVEIPF